MLGGATPGLVVWVPPKPLDRVYWYSLNPRTRLKTPLRINRQQYVRPSLRYDLTRLCACASWSGSYPRQNVAIADEHAAMKRAKHADGLLKKKIWQHPLVGHLNVTRFAWRHITRRSKKKRHRLLSLRAVPYLKTFLEQAPFRFSSRSRQPVVKGRQTVETRFVLCWYRSALSIDGKKYSLLLRIKEEIRSPTDWEHQPLNHHEISQQATLASWWCKNEEK